MAPIVGVGAVVVYQGRVLLVQRGHEPLKGKWSLPGGMLELGESLTQAVVREVHEETGLNVEAIELVELIDRIHRESGPSGDEGALPLRDCRLPVPGCRRNLAGRLGCGRGALGGAGGMEQPLRAGTRSDYGARDRGRLAAGESTESIQPGARLKRIFKWIAFAVVTLIASLGLTFWLRPLAVFRVLNKAQMYLIGARGNFTDVAGYRIHYYTLGPSDGPVVVLVHGLGGRSEDWGKLAPYLAKAGYRVYLPDLPGFGQSETPADFSYSVGDDARIVVGFFDALGLKQVDLGGWSMGGWIVQLVAATAS